MEFHPVAVDTGKNMEAAVRYILSLNISPSLKRDYLAQLFTTVGNAFYLQLFNANSELFNSTGISTLGYTNPEDEVGRLATKLVRNDSLGRTTEQRTESFFNSVLSQAQNEAFTNARAMQRHPTLTRSMRSETCKWCQAMAGTYTNPTSDLFARHANCDCRFVVRGYNSRNGELKNYKKVKKGDA